MWPGQGFHYHSMTSRRICSRSFQATSRHKLRLSCDSMSDLVFSPRQNCWGSRACLQFRHCLAKEEPGSEDLARKYLPTIWLVRLVRPILLRLSNSKKESASAFRHLSFSIWNISQCPTENWETIPIHKLCPLERRLSRSISHPLLVVWNLSFHMR